MQGIIIVIVWSDDLSTMGQNVMVGVMIVKIIHNVMIVLLGGVLLDCDRVYYLPMPFPFICDGTPSLEHEEAMVGKMLAI